MRVEWFVRLSRRRKGRRREEVKEGSLLLLSFEPKNKEKHQQICSSRVDTNAY